MRRPSKMVSVDCTVRPRSEMALAPAAKLPPAFQPWVIVPALPADRRCTASVTVLRPRCSSVSAESTVTGDGVSVSVRRISEPVTTIWSPVASWAAGAAAGAAASCADDAAGAASCANAGAAISMAPQSAVESRNSRVMVLVRFIIVSPFACGRGGSLCSGCSRGGPLPLSLARRGCIALWPFRLGNFADPIVQDVARQPARSLRRLHD